MTRSSAQVWSYPNLHGDVTVVASEAGAKLGATKGLSPLGEGTMFNSRSGTGELGYLGKYSKLVPTGTGFQPIIDMGARPYHIQLGRFLNVDPIEGGCANDYAYVHGDPINQMDLSGKSWWNPMSWTACGVAQNAGTAAAWTARGAAVAALGAVVLGTGGTAGIAGLASGLGWASTGASAVQLGAGAAAGDKYHVKNGVIGTAFGPMTSFTWGKGPVGAVAFGNVTRLMIYETGGNSISKGKC